MVGVSDSAGRLGALMGVPGKMDYYPVPAGKKRDITNNCWSSHSWSGPHGGNDLKPSAPGVEGEAVHPAYPGEVWWTAKAGTSPPGKWGSDYGNRVLIRHKKRHTHANGTNHFHDWFTFYAHLKSIKVAAGQQVTPSDVIGGLGNTGRSTAPHVHFALQLDSGYKQGIVDPWSRLDAARRRLL